MNVSRYGKLTLIGIGLALSAGSAAANDNFEQASQLLCEHIRECTLQTLDAQKTDSNMRQMVDGMVKGMCNNMTQRFRIEGYADIKNSAAACMRSMTEQDCDSLDSGTSTPACREYEKMAEKYSERGN